jgi:hypothetical protein
MTAQERELIEKAHLAALSEHTMYGNDAGELYDSLADALQSRIAELLN